MFIYSDHNGDHMVNGTDDINRLSGIVPNWRPKIVTDESGAVVGLQGGELELTKSMSIISNLRVAAAEETLRKAQKQTAILRKSFKQPLHRTRTNAQQEAASFSTRHAFDVLLRELDAMKRDQNQLMKARAWS